MVVRESEVLQIYLLYSLPRALSLSISLFWLRSYRILTLIRNGSIKNRSLLLLCLSGWGMCVCTSDLSLLIVFDDGVQKGASFVLSLSLSSSSSSSYSIRCPPHTPCRLCQSHPKCFSSRTDWMRGGGGEPSASISDISTVFPLCDQQTHLCPI